MPKEKLTNNFCKTIQYTGNKTSVQYFDTELKGFILEVRKSGGKTFALRYQRNRKTKVHRIGLLGHHNIAVTQRYAHLSHDSLTEAANCASILVSPLVSPLPLEQINP